MILLALLFIATAVLTVYAVLDWLAGPDPDLAAGGWSPETTCGNPQCRSHQRVGR